MTIMRIELVPLGMHRGTNLVPSGTSPNCATMSSEACAIMSSLFHTVWTIPDGRHEGLANPLATKD
jgi:hypothetical protein